MTQQKTRKPYVRTRDLDTIYRKQAQKLADKIEKHWAARGLTVRTAVVRNPYNPKIKHPGYHVVSSLVNGLPSNRNAHGGLTRLTADPRKAPTKETRK